MNFVFRRTALTVILIAAALTVHAKTASEIYEQVAKSTVVVGNINHKGKLVSFGSGVVLPDGSVVTNCHVVKDASQIKVHSNKNIFLAHLRFSDLDRDVCSLNAEGLNAPAIEIGNTKTLKVGAKIFAIGAPEGLELTLSDGIVSSLREVEGGHYLQITAAVSHGSSGGGLFDENGTLVGLTTFAVTEGQNLNFAVPVEWVEELAERHIMAEQKLQAEQKLIAEQKARAESERVRNELVNVAAKMRRKVESEKAEPSKVAEPMKSVASLKTDLELAEQEAEADRKADERRKLLAEKKAQAEERERAKQRELAEKKLQAEKELAELKAQAEQKAKAEQERIRAEQKALAEQERARAVQAAAIGKEVAEYTAKITAKIRRNIVMPPDIPYNVSAVEFYVTLMPGGMVLKAELIKSSGSAAYDSAVERAIKKVQPLPLPPDVTLFDRFRDLHLTVRPIKEYDRLSLCPGTYDTTTWTNCFGEYTHSTGARYVGEFKDDKFNKQEQNIEKSNGENTLAIHAEDGLERAVKQARLPALRGDAEAQYYLGVMYENGWGVTQDYAEAVKWYQLSAAQGEALAQYNLGVKYHDGRGVAQNYAEAVKWFRLAAVQEHAMAQHYLGVMYKKGQGVTQDHIRAYMWLNFSAASGNADTVKNRDIITNEMTSQQISQAQIMARDCQEKNFKGCE